MITLQSFRADLMRATRLLDNLSLLNYRNVPSHSSRITIEAIRKASTYEEEYLAYKNAQAFDLILEDESLLFFRYAESSQTMLSYGYLQCPYNVISYDDFVQEYGSDTVDQVEIDGLYEEYLEQPSLRNNAMPVRYDWSPKLYKEGMHPASHFHFGYRTDVRLSIDALLRPTHFILFMLRQFYLAQWSTAHNDYFDELASIAESAQDKDILPNFRCGKDHLELRLTSFGSYFSKLKILA